MTSRVLFASRPVESTEAEGGLQLQRDLAPALASEDMATSILGTGRRWSSVPAIPVYSEARWDRKRRVEFVRGLLHHQVSFDVVHTAHLPTPVNARLLRAVSKRGRRAGVRYVQTVTALPKPNGSLAPYLWGDVVVCQSIGARDAIQAVGSDARLITPWPSPSRVGHDAARRDATRADRYDRWDRVVTFPGEFRRLGVGSDFERAIARVVERSPDSVVVLACRYDREGVGDRLAAQFPRNVVSLGPVDGGIIELLEASDLVIYPARSMDLKFQPPMALLESLVLGTPVLASDLVELPSVAGSRAYSIPFGSDWADFGDRVTALLDDLPARAPLGRVFEDTLDRYRALLTAGPPT